MSNVLYLNQSMRDIAAAARNRAVWAREKEAEGRRELAARHRAIAAEYWGMAVSNARREGMAMPGIPHPVRQGSTPIHIVRQPPYLNQMTS